MVSPAFFGLFRPLGSQAHPRGVVAAVSHIRILLVNLRDQACCVSVSFIFYDGLLNYELVRRPLAFDDGPGGKPK